MSSNKQPHDSEIDQETPEITIGQDEEAQKSNNVGGTTADEISSDDASVIERKMRKKKYNDDARHYTKFINKVRQSKDVFIRCRDCKEYIQVAVYDTHVIAKHNVNVKKECFLCRSLKITGGAKCKYWAHFEECFTGIKKYTLNAKLQKYVPLKRSASSAKPSVSEETASTSTNNDVLASTSSQTSKITKVPRVKRAKLSADTQKTHLNIGPHTKLLYNKSTITGATTFPRLVIDSTRPSEGIWIKLELNEET